MSVEEWYNQVPSVESERLLLRQFQIADVEDMKRFLYDPEMYRYLGRNMQMMERNPYVLFDPKLYDPKREHCLRWGIVEKESKQLVGELILYEIEGESNCKMGCRIRRDCWNKGFANEATRRMLEFFKQSHVFPIVEAYVMIENRGSVKALEKSGFRRRATIRGGRFGYVSADYYIYIYRWDRKIAVT